MDFVKLMSCFGCLAGDPTDIVAATREKNPELVKYFETLVHARFAGETSNIMDTITDHNEVTGRTNLGSVLCKIDAYIRNRADIFTGNESLFLEYLDQIAIHRCPKGQKLDRVKKKILRDKTRFVELYRRRRTGVSHELRHTDYWGTRQQLRAGKVISDWIDKKYGGLDPVFGALLSPAAGRTGPGDSNIIHGLLFDENGPIAFHSAVHDAFGYLLNYHQTGPGYKYLGAFSIFEAHEPLSDQVSGIEFWGELLRKNRPRKAHLRVY